MTDAMRVAYDLNMRWAELVTEKKVETRTADEIKETIKDKLRNLGA